MGGVRDLRETLDHEMFGHFGLNTLGRDGKRDLLASIARSKNSRLVKKAFYEVKPARPYAGFGSHWALLSLQFLSSRFPLLSRLPPTRGTQAQENKLAAGDRDNPVMAAPLNDYVCG